MSLPELTNFATDFLNGKEAGSPFVGDRLRNIVGEALKAATKRTSKVVYVSETDASGTASFGDYFANGLAVAVMGDPGAGSATMVTKVEQADENGDVYFELDAAPGGGNECAVTVFIDAYDKEAGALVVV